VSWRHLQHLMQLPCYLHALLDSLRYDGEGEFRTAVPLRAYNIAAIEFTEGLRLRLGIVQKDNGAFEADNSATEDIVLWLGESLSELMRAVVVGGSPQVIIQVW
jgi:hypothetical protein